VQGAPDTALPPALPLQRVTLAGGSALTLSRNAQPEEAAFAKVLAHTGCEPSATVFFEDSLKNLVTAHALGLRTVLVGQVTAAEEGGAADWVDAQVPCCSLDALAASPAAAWLRLADEE